tara:strand:+ start:849 stop:1274 length:426 start_codon:yes stop_codon:yes gene_type:complete
MGIISKLVRKGTKKVTKKKTTVKKKTTAKAKPLNKTQLKALQRKLKESSDFARFDYVKVPKKAYTDEEKYEKMMRSGKKLTDAQLKSYSRAIKLNNEYMTEIDGREYVSRSIRDREKGTVAHALSEMDFLPKKYLDLYKKK